MFMSSETLTKYKYVNYENLLFFKFVSDTGNLKLTKNIKSIGEKIPTLDIVGLNSNIKMK